MELIGYLGYLVTGAVAGTMAGLFGVGGGIIVVPSLIFSFGLLGLDQNLVTHMAIATSLACMVFTSLSSIWTHQKHGNVDWQSLKTLVPALLICSYLGVQTALLLSGALLQSILGVGLWLIALNMFRKRVQSDEDTPFQPKAWTLLAGGGFIGFASSIFGIGGGVMMTPYLSKLGQNIRLCVGTAAACGFPIALMGSLTNIIFGGQMTGLPPLSTGLVYWPAFVGIVLTSIPCARLGARLAHTLPAEQLTRLFAIMLLVVGSYFLFF